MLPKDVETIEQILTERQQNLPGQEKTVMVYITENSLPKTEQKFWKLWFKTDVKRARCGAYMHSGIYRPHVCPATFAAAHKSAFAFLKIHRALVRLWELIMDGLATELAFGKQEGTSHEDLKRFWHKQACRNISRNLQVWCLPLLIRGRGERNLGRRWRKQVCTL